MCGLKKDTVIHIRWRAYTKKRATHHEPHVPTTHLKTIYIMMKALHICVKAYFNLAAHIHHVSHWYAIVVAQAINVFHKACIVFCGITLNKYIVLITILKHFHNVCVVFAPTQLFKFVYKLCQLLAAASANSLVKLIEMNVCHNF